MFKVTSGKFIYKTPISYKLKAISSKGFTIIEMVIAASLMASAMTFIAIIFLNSFVAQRKVIAFEHANSNARVILETLSREIRSSTICGNTTNPGSDGSCVNPANNTPQVGTATKPDNRLDIIRQNTGTPVYISYCFTGNVPLNLNPFSVKRIVNDDRFTFDPCADIGSQILNSPEVAVLATTIGVIAGGPSGFITAGIGQSAPANGECRQAPPASPVLDICQPRVTIILYLQSLTQREAKEKVEIRAQTTVTQRLIDVD